MEKPLDDTVAPLLVERERNKVLGLCEYGLVWNISEPFLEYVFQKTCKDFFVGRIFSEFVAERFKS